MKEDTTLCKRRIQSKLTSQMKYVRNKNKLEASAFLIFAHPNHKFSELIISGWKRGRKDAVHYVFCDGIIVIVVFYFEMRTDFGV